MCFSATASFTVAAACAGAGLLALHRCPDRKLLPLALMPLGFGAQQAIEGMVWLRIGQSATATDTGLYPALFVLFATVIWPAFVPFAARSAETQPLRRRIQTGLLIAGLLIAALYVSKLLTATTSARIDGHSIYYSQQALTSLPVVGWMHSWKMGTLHLMLVPYFAAAGGSLAVSSLPPVRWFAAFVAAALTIVFIADRTTLISVWCFFAATGSVMIVLAMERARWAVRQPQA
ncbi:MAG: DUF6629 family protein [Hyphomonas sp.]|uniref:DUF6629 family protein n=1 Tax=Hyphomonas sp. TaxID=87 RepID=UPI0035289514